MFNLFKRKDQEDNYFKEFEILSQSILEMTALLSTSVKEDTLGNLEEKLEEVVRIKEQASEKKQAMIQQVYEDFLPPIERADILAITYRLEELLEMIGELLFQMDSWSIQEISDALPIFVHSVDEASHRTFALVKELKDFKKAEKIFPLIQELRDVKKEGDSFYYLALKELNEEQSDSFEKLAYANIYDQFNQLMAAFEAFAQTIEKMIIGNS